MAATPPLVFSAVRIIFPFVALTVLSAKRTSDLNVVVPVEGERVVVASV